MVEHMPEKIVYESSSDDEIDIDDDIPEITVDLLNKLCEENSPLIITKEYGQAIIEKYDTVIPTVFSLNYMRLIGGIEMFEHLIAIQGSIGKAFDIYKENMFKYYRLSVDKQIAKVYLVILISHIYGMCDEKPNNIIEESKKKILMRGLYINRLWW